MVCVARRVAPDTACPDHPNLLKYLTWSGRAAWPVQKTMKTFWSHRRGNSLALGGAETLFLYNPDHSDLPDQRKKIKGFTGQGPRVWSAQPYPERGSPPLRAITAQCWLIIRRARHAGSPVVGSRVADNRGQRARRSIEILSERIQMRCCKCTSLPLRACARGAERD